MANESIRQLADVLGMATARLSGDPQRMQMALGLQQSRKLQEQENKLNQFIGENVPESQKKFLQALSYQDKVKALISSQKDSKIVEGIDGFKYYADTGKRVLPGLEKPKEEYGMKQDAAGYWRYTEGPDKGERVFVGVEKPDPLPDIKDESSLRKEFNTQSNYFKGIAQSFGKVAATDPTAAGDVSLIFAYMKMLDPGSVVREGEQATARQAEGVPGRVLNLYNRAITGESLTPDQRADFRKQAQNIYELALDDQSLNVSRYKDIAERKGFDPNVIVFDYSKGIQPIVFEMSLKEKSLQDLQNLNAANYSDEQLEIIAKVLAEKLGGS
jgi:hypothetical protein